MKNVSEYLAAVVFALFILTITLMVETVLVKLMCLLIGIQFNILIVLVLFAASIILGVGLYKERKD